MTKRINMKMFKKCRNLYRTNPSNKFSDDAVDFVKYLGYCKRECFETLSQKKRNEKVITNFLEHFFDEDEEV